MTDEFRDYFEILGVSPNADTAAINDAYRRRAKEVHPDRSGGNGGHEKFAELQDAYETLIDEPRNEQYRHRYRSYIGSKSVVLFERSVRDLFDDALEYVKGLTGIRKKDLFDLVIDKRFTDFDKCTNLDVPLVMECKSCRGFGAIAWLKCEKCGGDGSTTSYREVELEVPKNTPDGTLLRRDLSEQIVYITIGYR